jgi:hypothetical protein
MIFERYNIMIPVVAGEYKLVLVGDSAVGISNMIKENRLCYLNSWRENTMSIYSPPSV